ncbi:MAG: hypothetical protein QHH43_02365 [Candidatus Saccharicenans sp.]|jgi:hypothetical protein|nr:hypothetical protein [Candidatus Saccharicenans sp.]MDH7574589.1 hypothetical protein [Candidatus Saccharicenans sp.]
MRKEALIGMVVLGLFFFSDLAVADESYYSGSFARLTYVQGDVRVDRGQELGIESGEVNFVLTAGDKLMTEDGLVEVNFGRNNYLRADRYSVVEMVRLPESGYEDISLHLYRGRFYLRVSALSREKGFGLHTPDASFYVLAEGLYRFEVDEEGRTEAAVVEGELEVAGQEDSLVLDRGESVVAEEGYLRDSGRVRFPDDDFERWNNRREELLARASYDSGSYLPEEIREYEPELAAYGRWVYERPYGYVWVPVVTYVDWRPYFYGRWVWYPRIGWTWISAEPWGWAVYHYGRWHWRLGLGWYWIPTVHWGPAWVHWYWDSTIVAWCPLSYWNRPVVIINNHFYDRYHDSYVPVNSRALVMVRKHELQAPHHSRGLIRPEALRGVERIRLEARQPQIRPVVSNALRSPGLKTGSSMVVERNPSGLKRLSGSQLRSGEQPRSSGRLSGGVSSGQLRRTASADEQQPDKARSIRQFAPSSGSDSNSSRVSPDRARPGVSAGSLRPRAGEDEGSSRLRIDTNRSRLVREQEPSRQGQPDQGYRLRTAPEREPSGLRDNGSQLRRPAERDNGVGVIKERPAAPVRQENKNQSSVRERSSRVSSSSFSYRPAEPERNPGQLSSTIRSPRIRESNQGQERRSSYNLPSLSRPYGQSSVRDNSRGQERPAAISTPQRAQSRPAESQSSSSSSSRSGQSIRKKNG